MVEEYLQALHLQAIRVTPIIHEDAISSAVYKVDLKNQTAILKICYNQDRYRRELYFLKRLSLQFPVPKVLGNVLPTKTLKGALLMECLPGLPLSAADINDEMAFKIGALLASLHLLRAEKYGDLSQCEEKPSDPIRELRRDFQESIDECKTVLSSSLLAKAKRYFDTHLPKVEKLDGPCIVHRDFKPGNIIAEKQKISGVIDWEGGRGSFAQEDFIRMDRLVWANQEESKEPFLEGYKSIRPLPNIEEVLPFLRIARALGAVGFTIHRNTWNASHKSIFESNKSFLEQELL